MADYVSRTRSNTFRVKDLAAFKEAMAEIEVDVFPDDEDTNAVSIESDAEHGGWPVWVYDEALDDNVEIDIAAMVAPHLEGDSVAVLQEIGSEKTRYFIGNSVAVNAKGETREVSIRDIWEMAQELGSVERS